MLFRSAALLTATAAVASGKSVEVPMNQFGENIMSKARKDFGENIMSKARKDLENIMSKARKDFDGNANKGEAGAWVAKNPIAFQRRAISNEYFAFEGEQQDAQQNLDHFIQNQLNAKAAKAL